MRSAPKYQKLAEWIIEKVDKGELLCGDRLSTEHEMSDMFQVSRETVRHAISVLEKEGIVECRQGSGNYISRKKDIQPKKAEKGSVVIVSTYSNAYIFLSIIDHMQHILEDAGYYVQISFTRNRLDKEREVLERLLQTKDISGLIIEPTKSSLPNPNLDLYRKLCGRKIPILFFNSSYPELPFPHISLDDREAGYRAASILMDMGHRKVGGVFKSDDRQGLLRYQGYQEALMERRLPLDDEGVIWIDTEDQRTMVKDEQRFLRRLKNCTACVAYNDEVAYNLEIICGRHKIMIPRDLSIASIDNSELAGICEVPLASVVHPLGKLGEKAAENMLRLIEEPDFDANYKFAARMNGVRDSVCCCQEGSKEDYGK